MAKLPVDDLLVFSRKVVQTAIEQALGCKSAQAKIIALDATAGNGVDTEFLARAIGPEGLVLAFDVQDEALQNTSQRLVKSQLNKRVILVNDSHAQVANYLAPYLSAGDCLCAAMYNLGFLPGSSSHLATQAASSLASLEALCPCLVKGGVISIHCYAGHVEGQAEMQAVAAWAEALPWREWQVLRYEFCNKPSNREILFIITRKS